MDITLIIALALLPTHAGVKSYTLLFDSEFDDLTSEEHPPGTTLTMSPTSIKLLHAH